MFPHRVAPGQRVGQVGARRGPLLALALLVAALGSSPSSTGAAPVVEIKSHAQLQLDGVRRVNDMIVVSGRLFDPSTSLGLPENPVEVRVGEVRASAQTDEDGRFSVELPAVPGPQSIDFSFPGNDSLDTAKLSEVADPSLEPVELALQARPTPTGVALDITATVGGEPFAAPVSLFADRAGSDELKLMASTIAGSSVEIARKQLGGAGTRHFRAEFAGDETHQAASVSGTYEFTSASKTALAIAKVQVAYEDTLAATGKVVDEDGIGLAGTSVTLVAGDRRLAQGVTGPDGAYRFRVEGEILGVGQLGLQTLAEPGGAIQSSRSEPVVVKVSPPQPVPVTYTVIAFLATGLAAGAFFAARSKPWRRFAKAAPPAQQTASNSEAQVGGLVAARPSLVSTLRRAADLGFSGAVRDTVRGRPVPGAIVIVSRRGVGGRAAAGPAGEAARSPFAPPLEETTRLTADTTIERRAIAAEDGGFAVEDLEAGDWTVTVSALAHISESFAIAVPHRGELRGVRVDLVPVREKVFLLYQRAAMPVLPDPKLWGVWSPRQVVDHVRASRPSPALATLTDFVEEVYFSARPIEEAVLPAARQRVDAAIAERAAAS